VVATTVLAKADLVDFRTQTLHRVSSVRKYGWKGLPLQRCFGEFAILLSILLGNKSICLDSHLLAHNHLPTVRVAALFTLRAILLSLAKRETLCVLILLDRLNFGPFAKRGRQDLQLYLLGWRLLRSLAFHDLGLSTRTFVAHPSLLVLIFDIFLFHLLHLRVDLLHLCVSLLQAVEISHLLVEGHIVMDSGLT